jgi:hypothetical protein
VTFEEFERRAWEEWEKIPTEYRAGVDGLVVERAAQPHPSLPDVYTLGECVTESYPSSFGDADSIRSVVLLHYGSFFRLSRLDPEFDWDEELWETITHELQHHLESLAADDALVDMDYAADENHKRYNDEPFDPYFFRHGIEEDGWRRVDDEYFLELPRVEGAQPVRFSWRGTEYAVEPATDEADAVFLDVVGGVDDAPAALCVVLVPRRGVGGWLRALLRPARPRVVEHDVVARHIREQEQ